MRAIEIREFGGPEVLQLCERDMPVPGVGEVLIKVVAAGINRPDVLQRMGQYPVPPGASDLPGLEVAGYVVDGDLEGASFSVGDEVCALVQGGGYAEYCVAPVGQCLPVPRGLSLVEAASLPETYFTVWSNVFDRGGLKSGDSILIHGGTSGIGVAAIQLAKAFGARVFVTAGSDEKCAAAIGIGANRAINYRTENFEEIIKAETSGRGVDVILDMVAAKYLSANISALADDGRLVVIALLGGAKAELDLSQVLRRRLHLTGSTLRPRSIAFKAEIANALQKNVWPLFECDAIKPVIFKTFELEQAKEAHALMQSGEHVGKIVLVV
ncbi:NAD(P)H-quinone oxidoreductase [Undibacterium sp. LX40W]|uniref:NAD(P)H-quinone oxidoreductase n=1 Tax=Undibacterium nitidum TaxID=2762298 RepID=A0A923HL48_9BURK|nr:MULTISPECIES: NAD(P)H-quinone oxidoreductase [Undibacterium]MBC3880363.1 NAD(P)H-quinone oxidoreductase [Undibacterium nitidum]MBC3890901.1 NAD(P)H-quinone oxidoreductase [Undibacterium sp. LX40W]